MVLVDTSIWISLYRQNDSLIGQKMWALVVDNQAAVCGQIWVEYLGGFRKHKQRLEHEKFFKAFPFIETPRKSFELAAHLLAEHPHFGSGDAIIAATAIVAKFPLFTLDKDFEKLTQKGLQLF